MKTLYRSEIPFLLRLLGCFEISWPSLRFRLLEMRFGPALGIEYSVYHEGATLNLGLLLIQLYIHVPMVITQRPGTEDWIACYGFSFVMGSLHLNWRTRCKVVYMPWGWEVVRQSVLRQDQTIWRDQPKAFADRLHEGNLPAELIEQHRFNYLRYSGEVQSCMATIYGEEHECRWRALKAFSWGPKRIGREIRITFSAEMGEGAGSWKGGVIGTSARWLEHEPMLAALRRHEREARFGR